MKHRDIAVLTDRIAPVVRGYVEKAFEPIGLRLTAIEKRLTAAEPTAEAVKSLHRDIGDIIPKLEQHIACAILSLPKAATVEDLTPVIATEVEKAVAATPTPKDGRDGKDGVSGLDGKDGAPGERGADGAPGREGIGGKDGAPGLDGKDGAPGERGADGAPGREGIDGKDGIGLAGVVIDRAGSLIVTLADGSTHNLGLVVGKDGAPGLGFEDMSEEIADDGRTMIHRYSRGDQVKEIRLTFAVPLYRGRYEDGREYQAGDAITDGGSIWIAQRNTSARPETKEAGDDWRLAVKRGQNGKDLRPAPERASPQVRLK